MFIEDTVDAGNHPKTLHSSTGSSVGRHPGQCFCRWALGIGAVAVAVVVTVVLLISFHVCPEVRMTYI